MTANPVGLCQATRWHRAATRFVTQVTLYSRELDVAIAQISFGTGGSDERAALNALLNTLELNGLLIQADALHTSAAFSTRHRAESQPAPDDQRRAAPAISADQLPIPRPPTLPG